MTADAGNSGPHGQDRFQLTDRSDIVAVLRQLSRRPELITAYFNQGRESLVTAVLGVDTQRGEVELDQGPDDAVNRRALAADSLICMTREQNVSVRFRLNGLRAGTRADGPVFRAPLPDSVQRMQRREFFRVPMPVTTPVLCRIPTEEGAVHTFRAMDLSLGGVGLVDSSMALPMQVGDAFTDCELEIPGQDVLVMRLEVRNISRHIFRDGTTGRRLGLAFGSVSGRASTLLQRYLQRLQIAQRDTSPDHQ